MIFFKRIIPCLDFFNGRIVKGINFNNLVDIGNPLDVSKYYSDEGADELVFLDISATLEKRFQLINYINKISSIINIPLTVGGGLKNFNDIKKILSSGADKISLNSSIINNNNLIKEINYNYGSQCIVSALDIKRIYLNNKFFFWKIFINSGKKNTNINLFNLLIKFIHYGVGEFLITSIDKDGTNLGFDIELINRISSIISIPLICSGGFGNLNSLVDIFKIKNVEGLIIASSLHKKTYSIFNIKNFLFNNGINVKI